MRENMVVCLRSKGQGMQGLGPAGWNNSSRRRGTWVALGDDGWWTVAATGEPVEEVAVLWLHRLACI